MCAYFALTIVYSSKFTLLFKKKRKRRRTAKSVYFLLQFRLSHTDTLKLMTPWFHDYRMRKKKIESYYYRVYIKTIISRKALLKGTKKIIMIWTVCGSVHYEIALYRFLNGNVNITSSTSRMFCHF